MSSTEEHLAGLHEDGLASPDCIVCADLGWLDEGFDGSSLIDPVVRFILTQRTVGCEYGCPYGSQEHEARLMELERTGQW